MKRSGHVSAQALGGLPRPLVRVGARLQSLVYRLVPPEDYRVGTSRRYRAAQRRRTRAAARATMLIIIAAHIIDIVASSEHARIVVAIDLGPIGLAVAGWWSLARWARHHPEPVIWIVTSGMVVSMVATAVAVPNLAFQSTGYLLVLPGLLALQLPWRTSTHLAWLLAYLAISLAFLALVPSDELAPDVRGNLVPVLVLASGASLIGQALRERAQIRGFAQMRHLLSLRRQGDASSAQLTDAHGALRTLEANAQELAQRALHDPLTGLANRALLGDRLAHGLAQRGIKVAFIMLDLDDFKGVNDRLGHDPGDAVLVGAAERFASVLRSGDTLARLGGDEFAVVAPGVRDAAAACALTDRLLGSLDAPVRIDAARGGVDVVTVQASAGIAVVEAGACGPRELMRRADVALYRAKERGKSGWDLFEASMDAEDP